RDADSNSGDQAIVVAIIQMARTLDMLTIAEGVERQAQLVFLRERGCDEIQCYLLSKPLPAAPFETLLRTREHAREYYQHELWKNCRRTSCPAGNLSSCLAPVLAITSLFLERALGGFFRFFLAHG